MPIHLPPRRIILTLLGSAIQAFGIANIHACAPVTEGGVLGLTLLMDHWLGISPAISNFVITALCYFLGWRMLGREFILYSAISIASYSVFYALIEPFAPCVPLFISSPLAAAISGAIFIGVGAGLCVRMGGATCGDDALAMAVSKATGLKIQHFYLMSDLTVLGLSLSYIPLNKLAWSLLTVVLSGQIIGWVQRIQLPQRKKP